MHFLPRAIEDYAEAYTEPEPPLLAQLRRDTHLKTMQPRMLSGHWQGRLLSMVSKLVAPGIIVEVGTFTGYSALCLAEGLRPGGMLYTIERDPELAAFAQKYFDQSPHKSTIKLLQGSALNMLDALKLPAPIDLVFIDANKEEYLAYYQACLPHVRSGGVILTDNVLWSGQVVDNSFADGKTEALRAFNNFVLADARVEKILLPVRDGLYLLRKR
jgi:caffeoyl-CoA O-methyltransferase